jgi:hypothetical protein
LFGPRGDRSLAAEDLEVSVGGLPASAVGVAPPGEGDPWRIVLYFDTEWASSHEIRGASALLAAAAERLVALGEVDLVIAERDGHERRLVATRDGERLNESLSWMALQEEGEARATALRVALALRAHEVLGGAVIAAARAAERDLASASRDRLLRWLEEAGSGGARRLLVPVGLALPEVDEPFWRQLEESPPLEACSRNEKLGLSLESSALARTLAVLGWTVLVVRAQGEDEKSVWQLFPVADEPRPGEPVSVVTGAQVSLLINEDRKPKRARAFFELARTHVAAGELTDAEHEIRRAIFHFSDGKKTRLEEAAAWSFLGRLLAGRAAFDPAARAFARAQALLEEQAREAPSQNTPSQNAEEAPPELPPRSQVARLAAARAVAPVAAARLAEASAGATVEDPVSLVAALETLALRHRLTLQLPSLDLLSDPFEGHRLLVGMKDRAGSSLVAPFFVAAARPLPVLLASGDLRPESERLDVWWPAAAGDEDGESELSILLQYRDLDGVGERGRSGQRGPWRVVSARGDAEGCLDVRQVLVDQATETQGARVTLRTGAEAIDAAGELLIVEDLGARAWGLVRRN